MSDIFDWALISHEFNTFSLICTRVHIGPGYTSPKKRRRQTLFLQIKTWISRDSVELWSRRRRLRPVAELSWKSSRWHSPASRVQKTLPGSSRPDLATHATRCTLNPEPVKDLSTLQTIESTVYQKATTNIFIKGSFPVGYCSKLHIYPLHPLPLTTGLNTRPRHNSWLETFGHCVCVSGKGG